MTTTSTHPGARITFSPEWWNMIASTRIFVASFCSCSFGDEGFSDRVSMAAHELLENAVKYSNSKESPVECTLDFDTQEIRVSVSNYATPEQIAELQAQFAEIKEGDPLTVYLAKMQASLGSEKSQLGLARIQYEGEARLELSVAGDKVTLDAVFDLPSERSDG